MIILQAKAKLVLSGRECTCNFQSAAKTEFKFKKTKQNTVSHIIDLN